MRVRRVTGRKSLGFVSLDLFWILVLLAAAAFLAVRGIDLVEKRDQAGRLGRELKAIEEAVEKVAAENELLPGDVVAFEDYAPFLKKGLPKRVREEGKDQLGGSFGDQRVGELAVPDPATVEGLGKFWVRR